MIKTYVGEGRFTDDPFAMDGGIVFGDLFEHGLYLRVVVGERAGCVQDFGEIDGDDREARGLQQFLAEAHGLERAGARADGADARTA